MADIKESALAVATVPQYGAYLTGVSTPTTTPTNNSFEIGEFFTEQFLALTSAHTLTSQTALQAIFDVPASGSFNVTAATSYFFEGELNINTMSSTSGTFSLGFLGTASLTSLKYTSIATKSAIGTPNTPQLTTITSASSSAIVTATTATTGHAVYSGIVRISAGGTFIPAIGLSVAAAAVIGVNSWFRLVPIGSNTLTNSGNVS